MSREYVIAMVREGIDTAGAMYLHAYWQRMPAQPFGEHAPETMARTRALHDAVQAAKDAGEIRLELGERGDGARSWWVAT